MDNLDNHLTELERAMEELQDSTVGCGSEEVFTENMKRARALQAEISELPPMQYIGTTSTMRFH
jgi:hypothetical protein